MTHAVVLVIAAAMTGYSAMDRNTNVLSGLRTGAVTAEASGQAPMVGDVSLDQDGTIIKQVSIPTAPLRNRDPILYRVAQGDTVEAIARAFGVPWRDIIWSNPGLRIPLATGRTLKVPPMPGVVITVKRGDTPASLAALYGVDVTTLLGFNHLRGPGLVPGSMLVVPMDPTQSSNLSTGAAADPIAPGQLVCPITGAAIIQPFGPTTFALEPPFLGYPHFHTGIDLLAIYGTPIDAAAGGKVTAAGYAPYFGIRVEVTDSFGLVEIYAHMSQTAVSVGEQVQQGQNVGFVGSTGLSIGSHLHFQLEVGGMPTAPGPLIGCV